MKRYLIAFLLLAGTAFAQGVRYDNQIIQPENAVSHFLVYNTATIAICTAPANGVPCTNKATTYTDSTLGSSCATSTQVVLAGTDTCVSGTDSYGNWGVWVAAGQYEFTVTFSDGSSEGPFPFTATSGGGGSSTLNVYQNGTLIGSQSTINFIDSATIATSITNDILNNRIDITVNAVADVPHNLLSTTHQDTSPASPVVGDLIYASTFASGSSTWQINVAGSGYSVGDTLTVSGCTSAPVAVVDSISGGAITAIHFVYAGSGCTIGSHSVTGGTGTGATISFFVANIGAWVKLAGNSTTTKMCLEQTGTGTYSDIPAWVDCSKEPVDVGVTYNGTPTASLVLVRHPFPFAVTIPAGCTNSSLVAATAATASTTFNLSKCTSVNSCTTFGTAVIGASGNTATFTCASDTNFAIGDIIMLTAPVSPDATVAGIGGTIYGTRAGGL